MNMFFFLNRLTKRTLLTVYHSTLNISKRINKTARQQNEIRLEVVETGVTDTYFCLFKETKRHKLPLEYS